jgi:hypothetical protein
MSPPHLRTKTDAVSETFPSLSVFRLPDDEQIKKKNSNSELTQCKTKIHTLNIYFLLKAINCYSIFCVYQKAYNASVLTVEEYYTNRPTEALTAVTVNSFIFRDITPCNSLKVKVDFTDLYGVMCQKTEPLAHWICASIAEVHTNKII